MEKKITKTISVDPQEWDQFVTITAMLKTSASAEIQEFIYNYNRSHKAEANEIAKRFWELE